jgi:hypothetical protein
MLNLPDCAATLAVLAKQSRVGAFAGADEAAFAAAHAAMQAGCAYLIARGGEGAGYVPPPVIGIRRACNCLKELDRFLVVMIDALAAGHGAPHGDRAVYVREGDAAGRLGRNPALRRRFAPDLARLRAIGRIRALALGDTPAEAGCRPMADLALATRGHDVADQAPGAPFALGDRTLAAIARFYGDLAEQLRGLL